MLRVFIASFCVAAAAIVPSLSASPAPPLTLPDLFTPAPRASTSPLPEIGRVRSSYCRTVVNWSATAAQIATKNDVTLNGLAETLPEMPLDDYPRPKQERTLMSLRSTASEVRLRSREGLGAISNIRAYANTLSDATQRTGLIAYADAMDDALRNQMTAAEDMARAMVIAEGRRASFEARLQMARAQPLGSTLELEEPGSYHTMLVAIGARIDERETDVRRAERAVADRAKNVHC